MDPKSKKLLLSGYKHAQHSTLPLSPPPPPTPIAMSLARVVVDVGQLVLNQWATTPPHKAPQEYRFKTKGESVFGLAPLVLWVSTTPMHPALSTADNLSLPASKANPLLHFCTRASDHRPLPRPPTQTRLVGAYFIPLLPFFLAYGYTALPLHHTDNHVRDPLDGFWDFRPSTML